MKFINAHFDTYLKILGKHFLQKKKKGKHMLKCDYAPMVTLKPIANHSDSKFSFLSCLQTKQPKSWSDGKRIVKAI